MSILTLSPDKAIVLLDNFLGDGQAQTCTALGTGAGLVHPIETVKNLRQIFLWNPKSLVRNRDNELGFRCLHTESNLAAIWRILDGIVEDVV